MGKRMSLPALPSGDFRRSTPKSSKGTNAALVEHTQTHRSMVARILLLWLASVRARGGRSARASTSRPARALARVAGRDSHHTWCKFAHIVPSLGRGGKKRTYLQVSARSFL